MNTALTVLAVLVLGFIGTLTFLWDKSRDKPVVFETQNPVVTDIVRSNGVAGNWVWWSFLLTGVLTAFVYARLWRRSGAGLQRAALDFHLDRFLETSCATDLLLDVLRRALTDQHVVCTFHIINDVGCEFISSSTDGLVVDNS